MRSFPKNRLCAWVCAGILLAAPLTGCGGSPKMTGEGYTAAASSSAAPAAAEESGIYAQNQMDGVAADTAAAAGKDNGSGTTALPPALNLPDGANQKIIWTVDMSLETLEFDASLETLTADIGATGGYIESSSVSGKSLAHRGKDTRWAHIVARVPAGKLDSFLQTVSQTLNVVSTDRSSENITLEYSDVTTRKRSLETEQERLFTLLGEAKDIETIVALEQRLSEIRYQLDSYSSTLLRYDNLVDFSTVTMQVSEVLRISDPAPRTMGERISTGFKDTLYGMKTGGQDFVVWFVVNLPYLAIWAVILAAAALILRRQLRRVSARRAAAPPRVADYGARRFEPGASAPNADGQADAGSQEEKKD